MIFFSSGVSEKWLNDIGIYSLSDLKDKGVINAYIELKSRNPKISLNMLWGMQAKLVGISHLELPKEIKNKLKQELEETMSRKDSK